MAEAAFDVKRSATATLALRKVNRKGAILTRGVFRARAIWSKVFSRFSLIFRDLSKGFQNGSLLIAGRTISGAAQIEFSEEEMGARKHTGMPGSRARRIGYARVSTEDQNLALQLDALKAAGCTRVYCDEGVSGASRTRPALNEALRSLQPGDTLVTWRLDRLGRSLSHLIDIIEGLGSDRIEFCSLLEAMDTRTASGEFAFHILGAMAHFERRVIGERTRAGMASARARGVSLGRPPKLTAHQIECARRALVKNPGGLSKIARRLGVAPVTLARALKRQAGAA